MKSPVSQTCDATAVADTFLSVVDTVMWWAGAMRVHVLLHFWDDTSLGTVNIAREGNTRHVLNNTPGPYSVDLILEPVGWKWPRPRRIVSAVLTDDWLWLLDIETSIYLDSRSFPLDLPILGFQPVQNVAARFISMALRFPPRAFPLNILYFYRHNVKLGLYDQFSLSCNVKLTSRTVSHSQYGNHWTT